VLAALLIAAVALVVVAVLAWPLLGRAPGPLPPIRRPSAPGRSRRTLIAPMEAIREIEMDHRAGNLSPEDFAALDRAERARAGADAPRGRPRRRVRRGPPGRSPAVDSAIGG
jgi:hypothetical protein